MHYVLALWFEKKVKPNVRGEAHITIYADDYVCRFQYNLDDLHKKEEKEKDQKLLIFLDLHSTVGKTETENLM